MLQVALYQIIKLLFEVWHGVDHAKERCGLHVFGVEKFHGIVWN